MKMSWNLGVYVWNTIFPPPPPPPTVAFGVLPFPNMSPAQMASGSAEYTFVLETIGGVLPAFPRDLKVYSLPQPSVSFGDYDKMLAQAKKLGFVAAPARVGEKTNIWRFSDGINPFRHLEYDATTGNFHLYYDFSLDQTVFLSKNFATKVQLINETKNFFTGLGGALDQYVALEQNMAFYKYDFNVLTPTESFADADAVTVNYNMADIIDGKSVYKVITADPKKSLVSVMYSANPDKTKRVIEVKYYYSQLDLENSATYPLITPQMAFAALQSGQAYTTGLSPYANKQKQISIRKVYLAYLDPFPHQGFLQPVVVFSDERGFIALVPAISSAWLRKF